VCYHRTVRLWGVAVVLLLSPSLVAARPDALAAARRFYNEGQYEQAIEAARQAAATPSLAASARLISGRAYLERFRKNTGADDLDHARADLRSVDDHALDGREQLELQIGFAELLYCDERYGAAAEMLDPLLDAAATLAPDGHDRAVDWWASSLDREAQAMPREARPAIYARITHRMEDELRRSPSSLTASYWLAAATRGQGDLDRAWSAASAAWVRTALHPDAATNVRADIDKLVVQGIIPERVAAVPARDRRQALVAMTADWEQFKKNW
jgi:tetratricopeptide (TPR) repeat protein